MKKNVLVRVKGTQTNDMGEQDTIELVTEGKMFVKNKSYYILYNETAVSGMEGTTTTLKVEPTRVTLNRMGASEQKSTFEKGVYNSGHYVTPYGKMAIAVNPSKVDVDLTEVGGSINLEYELELDQEKVSDNRLMITVQDLSVN